MEEPKGGYLAALGERLAGNGYSIVPITPGKKSPDVAEWNKTPGGVADVRRWVKSGRAKHGVGFRTEHNPAVDIDTPDAACARHMEEWLHEHIGYGPVRVGKAPKRLVLFRSDIPFRKMQAVYVDARGVEQRIEILGAGQQFVAFHTHPDTSKPYTWLYKASPLTIASDDLPLLTAELARRTIDEFGRYAREQGWTLKTAATALARPAGTEDDPFADVAEKTGLSLAELKAKLDLIPNDGAGQDYDTWLQVFAGVYHETDGSPEGLELALDWSSRSNKHDERESTRKWESLDIEGKGRAPVTARFILKLAKEAAERAASEALGGVETAIRSAATLADLEAACAPAKRLDLSPAARVGLVGLVQQTFKRLKGAHLSITEARNLVRYEEPAKPEIPRWLAGYVYVSHDDTFYHRETQERLGQRAFNARYGRQLLTRQEVLEGKSTPANLPADVALHLHQIPTVSNVRYAPGEDDIFTQNGLTYANRYTGQSVPAVPDKLTATDRANVERVKAHFAHLFAEERDRRIFLDWLAYIVQTGRRPNWAVLLQGVEGDGKSFFGVLAGAVLGAENVRVLQAQTIEGAFNAWAEGQLLCVIEEIKLTGHNRHDVINRVKPLITNSVIEIHRKGVDPYNVPNTSAYLMTSNFRDALPVTDSDSRYFIIASRFQTKEAIDQFKAEHPDYYADLYAAVDESAGALRGWLMAHKFGPDFKPRERAPRSQAKDYMVEMNKSDEQQRIEDLLADSHEPDLCRRLLNTSKLEDAMGVGMSPWVLKKTLTMMGLQKLDRVKVGKDYAYFWSDKPELFMSGGVVSGAKVRSWIADDL